MNPSKLLTEAADLIRDTAATASPGVWSATDLTEAGHPGVWWVDCDHEDDESRTMSTIANCGGAAADARWIALLSPAVAPIVEAILRQAAMAYELDGDAQQDENALALARVILGEKA